ncbi:hypothetical protein [Chromobacterium vaccinii]
MVRGRIVAYAAAARSGGVGALDGSALLVNEQKL